TISGTVTVVGGTTAATIGAINLTDGQIGTLTVGSTVTAATTALTIGGTATNQSALTFEAGGSGVDSINLAGHLVTLNAGGAAVNIASIGVLGPGSYPLISYGSGSTLTGSFTLTGGPTITLGLNSATLQTTATALNLVVTGNA